MKVHVKITEHFFIYQKKTVFLYCETLSFDGEILTANVINGAWKFSLNIKTSVMTFNSPTGDEAYRDCRVLWLHDDRFGYDYNRAIKWATGQLQITPASRWIVNIANARHFELRKFWERLGKACRAFSDSWNGKKLPAIYEDQIPF